MPQFHWSRVKTEDFWVRDKQLYDSQNSKQHELHVCVPSLMGQHRGTLMNGGQQWVCVTMEESQA